MRKIQRIRGEEGRAYWAMVLPAFSIYLLVMAFPIILSIVLSVSNYDGGKMFGGERFGEESRVLIEVGLVRRVGAVGGEVRPERGEREQAMVADRAGGERGFEGAERAGELQGREGHRIA